MPNELALLSSLRGGPLWGRPSGWAYLDLLTRAGADGMVEGVSVRVCAEWWNVGRRTVERILSDLEYEGLILYPAGRAKNRPYPVEMTALAGQHERDSGNVAPAANLEGPEKGSGDSATVTAETVGATDESRSPARKAGQRERDSRNPRKMERPKGAESFVKGSEETSRVEHNPKEPPTPYGPPSSNGGGSGEKSAEQSEAFEGFPTDEERAKKAVHRLMQLLAEHGMGGISQTGKYYQKQAAILKRLAVDQGEEQTAKAIIGVALLSWFADGKEPFDAFHVERHFGKALAAYEQNRKQQGGGMDERVARQEARKAEKDRRQQEYERALEEWRPKAIELIRAGAAEAPEEIRALKREANEHFAPLPGTVEQKKYWAKEWLLAQYADRHGLSRPTPPP